jgi:hypothetical protein
MFEKIRGIIKRHIEITKNEIKEHEYKDGCK